MSQYQLALRGGEHTVPLLENAKQNLQVAKSIHATDDKYSS